MRVLANSLRTILRPRLVQTAVARPVFKVPAIRPLSTTFPRRLKDLAGASKFQEQPRLRLGTEAPNFTAETTHGKIDFHEFIGDSWVVLFSHPADFTPVCTTELGAFAKLAPEFAKRNVTGSSFHGSRPAESFPIIADEKREVAWLYDMVDAQDLTNIDQKGIAFTIRSVFVIDPRKKIRLTMSYPASTGRNSAEVLRVIDSLQTGDKNGVTTPIDWQVGQDVIVPPTVTTDDAKVKFGEGNVRVVKPYLRFTTLNK
ncbi:thioredoxin-like protein [Choiromyces venosus 120613-1]|uniref:Thioredoxin-like protein n=1 Tax=Choiromyces venosus 120613-1 TaxID=1336337 RepID=A0A3N4JYG5_9PEZI|nr:thioredoxin-like protein [Choiromyces venosus 120613-1]